MDKLGNPSEKQVFIWMFKWFFSDLMEVGVFASNRQTIHRMNLNSSLRITI